ncbi:MAG TPA: MBL fold metallo-hydrolase [Ferruginibacter sp.]|nr:MBL fold metallo-hydrolase [Ferruginibacter sp.]HRO17783.1 MBL fold metallo-hydrolase [Ferruginibacter sp.]HRQ21266.1 MBL fold metallo-hydrolase [Ferruginibacter sp.]
MKIIPLSEGSFTIDGTKDFIPFNTATDQLQERPRGSLLVEIQPFVVVLEEDIILLDTGLGFQDSTDQLQIHHNLSNAGIKPSDVTKVLLSHLHKDHAGGVGKDNQLNFPNAQYYIHQKELEYALEKGVPSYDVNDFKLLINHPQCTLLQDDAGNIGQHIRYEMPGGHCPFHLAFWMEDAGETVLFGGDVAPQLQQMKHKFIAKYDYDGKKSMEQRAQWWQEGREQGWTFLFYHDIKIPSYKAGI